MNVATCKGQDGRQHKGETDNDEVFVHVTTLFEHRKLYLALVNWPTKPTISMLRAALKMATGIHNVMVIDVIG